MFKGDNGEKLWGALSYLDGATGLDASRSCKPARGVAVSLRYMLG